MGEETEEIVDTGLQWMRSAWDFVLFKSGDTSVAVKQVVLALLLILLGILLSKRIARIVGRRLEKGGKFNANTVYVFQRLIAYLLIVVVTLVALPIAGIPITVFTVMGGAVAIGVGFGAQNLFNNLISGFIIMMEKPIRIGDIVELDGAEGKVCEIGNRCVRVRRGDGVDVLVPNSSFLEQPVVNWALRDAHLRGVMSVGVAYGSPCREVERLMLQAASEQERVLDDREPFVLFEDFGDNSLVFSLFYWAHVSMPLDLRRLNSELRFRIDELFAESGIVIAFPQRDVHLDASKPLEVKVLPERGSPPS